MNNLPITTTGTFNALLDKGSEFEGKLSFEGTVRIDGKFKGEIFSEASLIVGESGKVDADIKVNELTVKGEINGNIVAKTKVLIKAPAIVRGNISTPSLVIEEGVTYEGHCTMGKKISGQEHKITSTPLFGGSGKKEKNPSGETKDRLDS